jgi:thiol-disulfide isomerase/thioredoxin
MKTYRSYIVVLIIFFILTQNIYSGGKKEEVVTPTQEVKTTTSSNVLAPFTSMNLQGEEVTEAIFAPYDLTMVNVWGTFCRPCITEMPGLGELSREYKDKGVQVVGIVVDVVHNDEKVFMEKLETALSIIDYTKADYPHILQFKDLYDLYLKNIQVIPTTFFVDNKGNIVSQEFVGSRTEDAWRAVIDKTLSEYGN